MEAPLAQTPALTISPLADTDHPKIFGALWLVLGIAAIALPYVSTVASAFTLGFLLVIAGIANGVAAFQASSSGATWGSGALAVLATLAGLILIAQPTQGAVALTFVVGLWLLFQGVARLGLATVAEAGAGWVALSGVASLLLGGMLLAAWPGSGLWAIGLLVGADFIFSGISTLFSS